MKYEECDARHICHSFIVDKKMCKNCTYLNNGKWKKENDKDKNDENKK